MSTLLYHNFELCGICNFFNSLLSIIDYDTISEVTSTEPDDQAMYDVEKVEPDNQGSYRHHRMKQSNFKNIRKEYVSQIRNKVYGLL